MNRHLIALVTLTLLLGGCAASGPKTVITSPAIVTGGSDTATSAEIDLPTTVAVLPFENRTKSEFAYEAVRRTMFNHFSSKNYRMLHWRDVDRRLQLAGLDTPAAVNATEPAQLRQILGVDGLLSGNITHYNKVFAGIYSQISVGVELTFINASDTVVWSVKDVRRSHAGGPSLTPTGLLLSALTAGKHLLGDLNLYRTADDLGRALAKEMPEPPVLGGKRPPHIVDVVHSGAGKYLKYGDTLEVALEGDPGMTAAAVIEGLGLIDLVEGAAGQYTGSLVIGRSQDVMDVVVTGRLQDDFGQQVSWISPYGLLNVDNTAPGAVRNLAASAVDGGIRLSWSGPGDPDVAAYTIAVATSETGPAVATHESSAPAWELTGLTNFDELTIRVQARDHAGNSSEPAAITAMAAPDPRFNQGTALVGELPSTIRGIVRLTAAGSPYQVTRPVTVTTGAALLVTPGAELVVSPGARLTILGEFHAFGTASDPVRVRGADGQAFDEFIIVQTTQAVTLRGLAVDGAGIPVQVNAGSPLIVDSVFTNSAFNALTIGGTARPTIRNCRISGAMASGVVVSGQAQPRFEQNHFERNEPFHLQNGSTYGIDARTNTFDPPASNMTILGDVSW